MSQQQKPQNNTQIFTGTQGLVEDSQLDKREKRIRKAVRLYYGDNGLDTQEQVAEEMGLSRMTIAGYLDSDTAEAFKKVFSDKEKREIERWMEEQLAKHYDKAINAIGLAEKRARENEEVNPQILANAGLSVLKADEKFVKLLKEIRGEKVEEDQKNQGESEVVETLREAYKDELEEQEDEKVESS